MDRAARVKDQEASGLSVVEYCRKVGIRPNNFYNWRKKKGEQRFALVETESRVSIELEGGLKLKVAVGDLKSVLAALR